MYFSLALDTPAYIMRPIVNPWKSRMSEDYFPANRLLMPGANRYQQMQSLPRSTRLNHA
jgi:hypothetical protein